MSKEDMVTEEGVSSSATDCRCRLSTKKKIGKSGSYPGKFNVAMLKLEKSNIYTETKGIVWRG